MDAEYSEMSIPRKKQKADMSNNLESANEIEIDNIMYDLKQLYSDLQAKIETIQKHANFMDSLEFATSKDQTNAASQKIEENLEETKNNIINIQRLIKSEKDEMSDLHELNVSALVELDNVRKILEESYVDDGYPSVKDGCKDDDLISINNERITEIASSKNLSVIYDTAKSIKQILTESHETLNNTISWLEPLLNSQKDQGVVAHKQFSKISKLKNCLEALGHIKCTVKNKSSIEIQICDTSFSKNLSKSNENTDGNTHPLSSHCLKVSVFFEAFHDNFFKIKKIELNQVLPGCEEIVEMTKTSSDIPVLVTFLKSVWASSAALISEIEVLREKHAIDWVPEERTLQLIPKTMSSCVISLNIPENYPWSGSISIKSITGCSKDKSNVKTPTDKTLSGWINHLEELFSNQ